MACGQEGAKLLWESVWSHLDPWVAHSLHGRIRALRLSRNSESFWLPKSPVCSSNEWTGSEDASSLEYYEHNVDNLALEVVGQNWSSEVISRFFSR